MQVREELIDELQLNKLPLLKFTHLHNLTEVWKHKLCIIIKLCLETNLEPSVHPPPPKKKSLSSLTTDRN